tara:strand:- start:770 stop:1174 length:405 start_codon:yes stop_codon:yes gene_type:complete
MLNFQSSGVGLSLIQTQSHIPPRLTSFSSGPSFFSASEFFSASDQELAPENYPEDCPEDYPVSTGQIAARGPVDRPVDNPVDLNSSNSHIYNVKLALVELSRQICSPNGAPRSSDLGVSIYKSQIADHKSQIAN